MIYKSWVWPNLKFQWLDDYYLLAATMREGDSRSCLQGHKVNLTSLQLMGMMSLAVKMTWKSAQCLWRLLRVFYGKNPQLSLFSVATTKWCILGQTQANHNLSQTVWGQIFIPSLFSQPLLMHCSKTWVILVASHVLKFCFSTVSLLHF